MPNLSSQRRNVWIPLAVGIVLSVMVGVMWTSFDRQREDHLRELVKFEAELYASFIDADIRARLPSLQRLVDRWVLRDRIPKDEFVADAKAYIKDLPGFQALEWVDSSFHVRWIIPLKGNEQAQNLNLAFEKKRRVALEAARDKRIQTMTSPIDLVQGGKGFLIYFPIYVGNRFDGFFLAVFKITPWLDYVFELEKDSTGFSTIVSIDNKRVYEKLDESQERYADWKATARIKIMNHNVEIEVIPTQAFFIANRSRLPEWSIAIGLLLTALVSYMSHTVLLLKAGIIERKQAERGLVASEAQLSLIFKSAYDAIIVIEVMPNNCFRFTSVNPRALELTGLSENQMVGKLVNEVIPEPSLTVVLGKYNEAIRTSRPVQWEEITEYPTGKKVGRVTVSPVFDAKNNCVQLIGTVYDITELKKTEDELRKAHDELEIRVEERTKELRKSEANLAEAQRIANLGSWKNNITTGEALWSDQRYRIFGYEPGEIEPTFENFKKNLHPNDCDRVVSEIMDAIKTKERLDTECRIIWPNGEERIIHIVGEIIHNDDWDNGWMSGTILDITKRYKAERELAKKVRELDFQKTALDEHAIVSITDVKGNITYTNDKLCYISGYSVEELIGQNHRILNSGLHSKEFFTDMWQTIANGEVWHGEIKNKKKNADYYWVDATIVPFLNDAGKPFQYVAIRTDITNRKDAEKALEENVALVELLHTITATANETSSMDDALLKCLRLMCTYMNWPVGHVYMRSLEDKQKLIPTDLWYLSSATEFEPFREITMKTDMPSGIGLPGRVLAEGTPVWIEDISKETNFPRNYKDPNFPRAKQTNDIGLRAGFAFPVYKGLGVVAVLELFSPWPQAPDENVLQTMNHVGIQLGHVAERAEAEEKLHHLANHDALTGLPSARLGRDRLAGALAIARRSKTMAALMFLDLDGFKAVNDTFGHEAGDQLLRAVADRLTSCLREVDTVARIGGDEFLIVLTSVGTRTGVEKVAQSVINTVNQPFHLQNNVAKVGASIGIALYPDDGKKPEELLKSADKAMYIVKSKGKNNFGFASD